MRKRILLMLCVVCITLGLAACGADPKSIDYNGYSYDELEQNANAVWQSLQELEQSNMESYVVNVEGLSEAERSEYMAQAENQEMNYNLIKSWSKIAPEVGEFQKVDSFNVTKSGKTTTAELKLQFEKRPVLLSCVYDNYDMKMQDMTIDMVYSTGEKMQKAALNTAMGMGTVFIMLIVICLIISCFGIIPKLEAKKKQSQISVQPAPAVAEPAPVQADLTDDLELIAVISAAIAADSGQSADDFIVRSIKRR